MMKKETSSPTIWHLQLHSTTKLSDSLLQKIVTEKRVIGMALSWKNKRNEEVSDPHQFRDGIQIGDVVLIRNGRKPLYLVEVISEAFIEQTPNEQCDWFPLRRSIRILSEFDEKAKEILEKTLKESQKQGIQALGTLSKCKKETATKKFIIEWWKMSQ